MLATGAFVFAACGASATLQERAGDAVNEYIAGTDVLSDGGFDEGCIESAARGLSDEVAQEVIGDRGRIDFDVDERDRDDVYDFYNCAEERDLAQAITDDSRDRIFEGCLDIEFDQLGIGEYFYAEDGDDPSRLGDFDNVERGRCGAGRLVPSVDPPTPEASVPETTVPPATAPPTTAPPTTEPPATAPPATAPPATAPPATPAPTAPPATTPAQPMPDSDSDPAEFAEQAEDFLNDDSQVSDAVGGDVNSINCTRPSSIDVDTNYLCFGQADGFGPIEFEVRIDTVDSFLVEDFRASFSGPRIIFFQTLADGLVAEDLNVDQVCVRNIVEALSEADVQLVVDNINDPELPDGVTFDEGIFTSDLVRCVTAR